MRACAAFIARWPEALLVRVASVIGSFWFGVVRYRRQVILANLAQAFPEQSAAERRRLGRTACVHLVRTLLEFLRIPRYQRAGYSTVRLEGLEHIEAARAKGKGVLCMTGHLGSFELAVAAAGACREVAPASLLVKPFPGVVDRFINDVRRSAGLRVIHSTAAMKPVLSALKRNECVAFALDQNATRKIGVFVDFFGRSACTMSGLAVLALRTHAAVVGVSIWREPDGTHCLRIHPEFLLEHRGSLPETVRQWTQVYTRFLEDAIRAHPEQWFWTHKRWRTRELN